MENPDTYKPKKKALVIAVSDYLNLTPTQQLPFCKNDGDSMVSVLSELGYEVVAKHIGTVTGDEFKDSIIDFFRDEGLNTKDTTLFYFSGHGVSDKKGSGKYFGTTDINPEIPERKGIPYDFLIDQMEKSNSLKRIAILDCCYSGAAHPYVVSKAVGDPEREIEKLGREDLKVFEKSQGICVLASSLSNKLSYFIEDKKMSTYTHYIIEGLKGNKDSVDKQGFVTPSTLEEYAFSQMLKSDPKMQRPVSNLSTSGKLVLAYHETFRQQDKIEKEIRKRDEEIQLLIKELEKLKREDFTESRDSNLIEILKQAQSYFDDKKYAQALELYDKALKDQPNNSQVIAGKGMTLLKLGRYNDAIKFYDDALERVPEDPSVWNAKGGIFERLGKYEDAIIRYDKAIMIDSGDPNVWYHKGQSLKKLHRYKDAIECFDRVLKIDPEDDRARDAIDSINALIKR